jgi:hypothetical protein
LRSALISPIRANRFLPEWPAEKLRVHYDPNRPETWFLPDEFIEGCKVEQKIGLSLNTYGPK